MIGAQFAKSMNEVVQVQLKEFKGNWWVDVRVCALSGKGKTSL